jgi:hypothetical protein
MPDPEIIETEDQTLETDGNLEEVEDNPTEQISPLEDEKETKQGILDKIRSIKDGVFGTKDEEEFEVPEDFAKAWDAQAEKNNWTEDDLFDLILEDGKPKYTDEELLEMIPFLSSETEEADESEDSSANEEDTQKDDDKEADEKLKKYEERIAALEKALAEGTERTQKEEAKNLWDRVSKSFDESGVEVFGKTEQLPRFPDGRIIPSSPQYKARQEVWDVANVLQQAGRSLDESMSIALNAFKGKNLETDVKREVIKDMRKSANRLSAKRTSHEPSKTTYTHGADVIADVKRKHGREEYGD